jgi:hypothetical protein
MRAYPLIADFVAITDASGTLASDVGQRSIHPTLVFSAYAYRFVPQN